MRFRDLSITCLLAAVATAQECYYPDGNKAIDYDYEPCPSNETTFSQCCVPSEGEVCLPNGMCSIPSYYDYRPPCTDKSYKACIDPCVQNSFPRTWVEIKQCATDEYCCNADPEADDCCFDENVERFTLDEPDPAEADEEDKGEDEDNSKDDEEEHVDKDKPEDDERKDVKDDSEGSGGLSAGSAGAIGGSLGGAAVICIIAAAWWFVRRKGKQNEKKNGEGSNGDGTGFYYPVEMKPGHSGYYAQSPPPASTSPGQTNWTPSNATMIGSPPQQPSVVAEMDAVGDSKQTGSNGLHEIG